MRTRILVVDDEPAIATLIAGQAGEGCEVAHASNARDGMQALVDGRPDVLITDLRMPGMDGLAFVRAIARTKARPPIIVMSGDCTLQDLVEFLHLGVVDVLVKPFSASELRLALTRALAVGDLWARASAHAAAAERPEPLATLIGEGELLKQARAIAHRAAGSPATLLIEGPSGSGKTLVARAVHALSARADAPLVEVACAALAESLLEGELFGHAAGAFTGALRDHPGVFERARHGTVLLDEVSALSPAAQSRLARALTSREFTRLGESRARPVEARIIATTQLALEPLVEQGLFRRDLCDALNVLTLRLPALRELGASDIEAITRFALADICARLGRADCGIDASFVEVAARLKWPGNVRELRNVLERALILGAEGPLSATDLAVDDGQASERFGMELPEAGIDLRVTLAAIEMDYIARALQRVGGNREAAAGLLGLRRTALVGKLRRHAENSEDKAP